MIQKKATIPLQLDGQFDSHLYEGRQIQMVLSKVWVLSLSRIYTSHILLRYSEKIEPIKKDKVIGETSIEVQRMAEVARGTGNHSSIIKGVIQKRRKNFYTLISALIILYLNNLL